MIKKLRIKFVVFSMSIVTVMLCLMFALVLHSTSANLKNENLLMMQSIAADPVPDALSPAQPDGRVQLPYFSLELTPQGQLTKKVGNYYDLSDEELLKELIQVSLLSDEQTGTIPEYNLRYLRVSTPASQRLIFSDISSEKATVNNLMKNCIIIGCVSFIAFFILSVLLSGWAVRPVGRAWTQQRQFISDASHELKTPLTVILTNAEMLDSENYPEGSRKQLTNNILTMSRQMHGLVENLLELARIENNTANITMEKLDFTRLAEEALLPFEPVFYEKSLPLESRLEKDIFVKGSSSHLTQLISILLDNAQKYSLPGGTIEMNLKADSSRYCLLSVTNSCAPIPEKELGNLFKRFYRADNARTMNRSYGLGLSIAHEIADRHHGRIWCETEGERITFYVRLLLA